MTDQTAEDYRQLLEKLDSDTTKHVDALEWFIIQNDIAPECDDAQDMIDLLEEIRGIINA